MNETVQRRLFHSAVLRFTVRLAHLFRSRNMFPPGHPSLELNLKAVGLLAGEVVRREPGTDIHLLGSRVYAGDTSLRPPKGMLRALRELMEYLGERGLGGVRLNASPSEGQLMAVLDLLEAEPGGGGPGAEVLNRRLTQSGVLWLSFHNLRSALDDEEIGGTGDPALVSMRLYLRGVRAVHRLYDRGISAAVLLELHRITLGICELSEIAPVRLRVLCEPRDFVPHVHRHPMHMAIWSVLLGQRFGLSRNDQVELAICAFIVDVGMRHLPEQILSREAELDEAQVELLRGHPITSVQELLAAPRMGEQLRRRTVIAFEHHIAGGYPSVLRWPEPHLYTQIISLVDAFDALRSDAPWHKALSGPDAVAALRGKHPDILLDHLADLLTFQPPPPEPAGGADDDEDDEPTNPGVARA